MPQFKIEAADQATGQHRTVILAATDASEAERQVQSMGLRVERVALFNESPPLSEANSSTSASKQPGNQRVRSVTWLAITCLLTGAYGLYASELWEARVTHDAYENFTHICGLIALPIDALLVASSAGLLLRKPWARRWLLRWAVISLAYQTLQLGVTIEWIAPRATAADLSPLDRAMQDLEETTSGTQDPHGVANEIDYGVELAWVSMFSLQSWALVTLNMKAMRHLFEPNDAAAKTPLS